MPVPEIEDVRDGLDRFEERIRDVVDRAWARAKAFPGFGLFVYGRTKSNIVFDYIAQEALSEFSDDPLIHVMAAAQSVKFLFRDRILVRFKKGNAKGIGSNIETQALLAFVDPQLSLPDLLPNVSKVEICYRVDSLGTELKDVAVVARNRRRRLWAYSLPGRDGGAAIIPMPTRPMDHAPPIAKPKRGKKQTDIGE